MSPSCEAALRWLAGAAVVVDAQRRVVASTVGAHVAGSDAASLLDAPGGRAFPLPDGAGWVVLLEPEASPGDADEAVSFHGIATRDPAMKAALRLVERVAHDDAPVLVRGETGAGKELVAHALHAISGRREGPFVALNCAALPPSLLESELFGHAKGAFTGAVRDAPGHVAQAHRGTLFLDEVAELPLEVQAKLLRVLETKSVLPVGGRQPVRVDVRFVAATHRSLRREVEQGRFRADLMYRLRVVPVFLPPLRERVGDVTLLCERFREEMNRTHRRRIEHIAPAALDVLTAYDWPGNVRELRNVLAYAYAIGEGPVLLPTELPRELFDEPSSRGAPAKVGAPASGEARGSQRTRRARTTLPRDEVERALAQASGHKERAAELLGCSRVTLWRRMKELGIGG